MRGSARSGSPGSGLLTRRRLVEIAERHGLRPRKSLGQHFLADANLARAIAREAGAEPGTRVLEVGAGLGSLTLALAEAGAEVLAVEIDPRVAEALRDSVAGQAGISVVVADATRADWQAFLGDGAWRMASNLPYNAAARVVVDLLESAPRVDPMIAMVQREVGERLAATPGSPAYGAVSLRVAYRASVRAVRRVPPRVFWPEPKVESVLLRIERRPPPIAASREEVFRLVDEGFAQRRKTLASALVRLGETRESARGALRDAGLDPGVRAEALGLVEFGRLAEALDG